MASDGIRAGALQVTLAIWGPLRMAIRTIVESSNAFIYTLFVCARVAFYSAKTYSYRHNFTMRLTSTGQLSNILRSNAGRSSNKLRLAAASTYGVRSLTSGTYRVPKAFNEPNVCPTIVFISNDATQTTDHSQSYTSSPTPPNASTSPKPSQPSAPNSPSKYPPSAAATQK